MISTRFIDFLMVRDIKSTMMQPEMPRALFAGAEGSSRFHQCTGPWCWHCVCDMCHILEVTETTGHEVFAEVAHHRQVQHRRGSLCADIYIGPEINERHLDKCAY